MTAPSRHRTRDRGRFKVHVNSSDGFALCCRFFGLLFLAGWSFALVVLLSFSSPTEVLAAGEDTAKSKLQYFETLRLTPDGVAATDTLGLRWRYQFDSTRWLLETRSSSGRAEAVRPEPAIKRCTDARSVGGLQSRVLLGYEEYTEDDIIARGNVTIKGWAKGNITSLTGKVVVNDGARVDGNITAPEIDLRPGSELRGTSTITSTFGATFETFWGDPYTTSWWTLGISLAVMVLFSLLILILWQKRFNYAAQCLEQHHSRALLAGVAAILSTPVIAILLLFTFVGILLIPLLPIVLLAACSVGFLWAGAEIAVKLSRKTPRPVCIRWGWLIILVLLSVGWFLAVDGWQYKRWEEGGQAIFFGLLSLATLYLMAIGLGAMVLTRFGKRPYLRFESGAAAGTEVDVPRPELPAVTIPRYARTERPPRRSAIRRNIS